MFVGLVLLVVVKGVEVIVVNWVLELRFIEWLLDNIICFGMFVL